MNEPRDLTPRRRVAGRAALTAGILYLFQPVVVALSGLTGTEDQDFLLPSQVRSIWWSGALQGAVLLGVGLGLLALVLTVDRVRATTGEAAGLGRSLASVLGVVGAVGWLLATSFGFAGYSTVAAFLSESGADVGAQRAALHTVNISITAALVLSAFALAFWLVELGRADGGRRLLGSALSVFGYVVAAAMVGSAVYGIGVLGMLLLIPWLLWFGIRQLRQSRHGVPEEVSPVPIG